MAKRTRKKRKAIVFTTPSGAVVSKLLTNAKMSSRGSAVYSKHPGVFVKRGNTVKIIRAVDKIYNQETSDIERLARIYSVKE